MSSSDLAVRIENLGKRYVVPHQESDSQRGRFRAHLKSFLPFLRDREEDYFWALKDVSLEVKQGDVLGILGKNGSGKSTLLKILSQVTLPTEGRVTLRGRVGSLLEVGTGFHPDLTGRENVFMSGVLLGLKRAEIAKRFDEIVEFSGIEKFIDMPVKHYSSGMYVRLAYAVASMLRSDILVLDEVMAVGDASFREKSQKNIEKIAGDGRTVLFVSHNIQAIRSICTTGVLLTKGRVTAQGSAEEVATTYMRSLHGIDLSRGDISDQPAFVPLTNADGWEGERPRRILRWVETLNGAGKPTRKFNTGDAMVIRIGYELAESVDPSYFTVFFIDEYGARTQVAYSLHASEAINAGTGGVMECRIDDLRLIDGIYSLTLDFGRVADDRLIFLDCVPDATQIRVSLGDYLGPIGLQKNQGYFAQRSSWRLIDGNRAASSLMISEANSDV